jgi:hypothetical protein
MVLDRFQLDHHTVENYGDNDADDEIDLPGAHPISALLLEWDLEDGSSNVESAIDKLDVTIGGESLFSGISGATMRNLIEWWRGRVESAPSDGLTETHRLYIPFSRFPMDGSFMLPAHEFNASLTFQGSRTTSDTKNDLRVYVEQVMQVPEQMVTPKVSNPDTASSVAGGSDWKVEGKAGRRLASLYLEADNTDLLDGSRLQVHNNNRQETPYEIDRQIAQVWALQERNHLDDAITSTFVPFPYDRERVLKAAIPTGRKQALRDFNIEGTAASGATSGDIDLLQEDYVVL